LIHTQTTVWNYQLTLHTRLTYGDRPQKMMHELQIIMRMKIGFELKITRTLSYLMEIYF
jgi:hypothetical protein